jgi:hypothetical protein
MRRLRRQSLHLAAGAAVLPARRRLAESVHHGIDNDRALPAHPSHRLVLKVRNDNFLFCVISWTRIAPRTIRLARAIVITRPEV